MLGLLFISPGSGASAEYVKDDNAQSLEQLPLLASAPSPLDPKGARGGGEIQIVDDQALLSQSGPVGTVADRESASSDQISVYVVREGDTLSQIAEMFNVTTNTIRWANDIGAKGTITPGEKLVILPITGIRYTVEEGDTLKSIVKEHGGDITEVRNYNALTENAELAVGDVVIIPHGEVSAPAPSASYTEPSAPARPTVTGAPTYAGYYMRPIRGGLRTQGLHGYNGVDLATNYGAEIYAAASGDVIISRQGGWNGGYGSYVVVRHDNGTQTLYAHNSQNIVSVGQHVVQGQVIGYIGTTGQSTGAHVHFEIRGATNPF